ncbi:(deoxy)nucleoside triphosphate pyrophosphohydrolase [Desulfofustis glycolicus]|uniref:8-oxo-dGTP diphosphatase n=1 Tax=Desulfofustis glycolicus DSM 9705 TaxID=1121409 RepID=A0A1M5RWE7_9BACT|nr:(deoxy)nucleoside triphosphate pyrophosphohydrolase [Desulfofustis glycolicus]MCB2216360.1 (deoxy)nucleoside triphosphate pyrophosphohydrolase [Desulfobulbaceae bacterium]SHH30368.1 8-oxo-dGTP diphosphatase [Desulfofustis glycolicus DSM 9705]
MIAVDPPVRVVVGLLFNDTGRILIARRSTDKRYGGLWEFPGGKVEPGESDPAALRREMREELDAPIIIARVFAGYRFTLGHLSAEFIPISGSIDPADITLLEHDAHHFITADEIAGFPFAPYDKRAITMLRSGLV